jgi:hypothetical protein
VAAEATSAHDAATQLIYRLRSKVAVRSTSAPGDVASPSAQREHGCERRLTKTTLKHAHECSIHAAFERERLLTGLGFIAGFPQSFRRSK